MSLYWGHPKENMQVDEYSPLLASVSNSKTGRKPLTSAKSAASWRAPSGDVSKDSVVRRRSSRSSPPHQTSSEEDEDDKDESMVQNKSFREYGCDITRPSSIVCSTNGKRNAKPQSNELKSSNLVSSDNELFSRVKPRRNRYGVSDRGQPPITPSTPRGRVAAYCTSESIGLYKLLKWLEKQSRGSSSFPSSLGPGWKNKMYMGVVHSYSTEPFSENETAHQDAFYFATGCCVFWGMTREQELLHLSTISPFSTGNVTPVEELDPEHMEFTYGSKSFVASDAIVLSSQRVEEKLAISFALAQSAQLDVFEGRVEARIQKTKHIPFNLATTGSIQYSHLDISKLIGQLFIELANVNLHSDILDEPDFLWEDDEYEPFYKQMIKYLDVENRVKILNKRLDILRELVEVLNQELTRKHGTKLEMIIIWLLVAEILISVGWNIILKDLCGFFNHGK